jgi:YD repeat-containing protein
MFVNFCRPRLHIFLDTAATYNGSASQATVTRTYDALGRLHSVSNPDRAGSGALTTTSYDELDRVTDVQSPDGSHIRTCYTDNTALSQDPASVWGKSTTDALGRLTQVVEDASGTCQSTTHGGTDVTTTYVYDGRNNLKTVTQGGWDRAFTYDELSRLKSATSPETGLSTAEGDPQNQNGTISYEYDPQGNLSKRTDPRTLVTTISYDLLNRPVTKTYSGGTPLVFYCYDGNVSGNCAGALSTPSANLNGQLTRILTSDGTNTLTKTDYANFDTMGRALRSEQGVGSNPYTFQYTYNDVSMKTETYPSGRVLTFGFDAGARVSSVNGQFGGPADKLREFHQLYGVECSGEYERGSWTLGADVL